MLKDNKIALLEKVARLICMECGWAFYSYLEHKQQKAESKKMLAELEWGLVSDMAN